MLCKPRINRHVVYIYTKVDISSFCHALAVGSIIVHTDKSHALLMKSQIEAVNQRVLLALPHLLLCPVFDQRHPFL